MAFIKTIDESESTGELKKIYQELKQKRGKIANILKIHSLLPQTMTDHLQLYAHIMFNKSTIKREDKELIAVIISRLNNCNYCVNHHMEALNYYWKDKVKIKELIETLDYTKLKPKQKAMLEYAEILTKNPDRINEKMIEKLKQHDITDKELLEINLIISYFNFVNRIALGLNVEFSEEEIKGYNY